MKLKIDNKEIIEILEMHSKERKRNILEQTASQPEQPLSVKDQLQGILNHKCVPFGTVVQMNSKNPNLQFAIKQESKKTPGKFRYLFLDKRVAVSENGKMVFLTDKWECSTQSSSQPSQSGTTVTSASTNDTSASTVSDTVGQANQARTEIDGALAKIDKDYNLNDCAELIDNYFKLAQVGGNNPKLNDYKKTIESCVGNNRRTMREKTRDQLRWLSGREAKNFLGGQRFGRIGSVNDTASRRLWMMANLPRI